MKKKLVWISTAFFVGLLSLWTVPVLAVDEFWSSSRNSCDNQYLFDDAAYCAEVRANEAVNSLGYVGTVSECAVSGNQSAYGYAETNSAGTVTFVVEFYNNNVCERPWSNYDIHYCTNCASPCAEGEIWSNVDHECHVCPEGTSWSAATHSCVGGTDDCPDEGYAGSQTRSSCDLIPSSICLGSCEASQTPITMSLANGSCYATYDFNGSSCLMSGGGGDDPTPTPPDDGGSDDHGEGGDDDGGEDPPPDPDPNPPPVPPGGGDDGGGQTYGPGGGNEGHQLGGGSTSQGGPGQTETGLESGGGAFTNKDQECDPETGECEDVGMEYYGCDAPPLCHGDLITCGQIRMEWNQQCASTWETEDLEQYVEDLQGNNNVVNPDAFKSMGEWVEGIDDGEGVIAGWDLNEIIDFNYAPKIVEEPACIPSQEWTIMGQTYNLDFSQACTAISYIGLFIIISAYMSAAMILYKGLL
jgi:hypothetical protein